MVKLNDLPAGCDIFLSTTKESFQDYYQWNYIKRNKLAWLINRFTVYSQKFCIWWLYSLGGEFIDFIASCTHAATYVGYDYYCSDTSMIDLLPNQKDKSVLAGASGCVYHREVDVQRGFAVIPVFGGSLLMKHKLNRVLHDHEEQCVNFSEKDLLLTLFRSLFGVGETLNFWEKSPSGSEDHVSYCSAFCISRYIYAAHKVIKALGQMINRANGNRALYKKAGAIMAAHGIELTSKDDLLGYLSVVNSQFIPFQQEVARRGGLVAPAEYALMALQYPVLFKVVEWRK